MRTGTNQRPLTPGQGQQSQQESLAAAAAANPALAYAGMPGWCNSRIPDNSHTVYLFDIVHGCFLMNGLHHPRLSGVGPGCLL